MERQKRSRALIIVFILALVVLEIVTPRVGSSVTYGLVLTGVMLFMSIVVRIFVLPKLQIQPEKLFTVVAALILLELSILMSHKKGDMTIAQVMRDAVLHEEEKISLFGLMNVNPSLISGFTVTGILLLIALIIRIFVIPKFKYVPGGGQLALEMLVGYFDSLAKSHSPGRNKFLGAYTFAAGVYICLGTLFELFGVQVVNNHGASMSLPAPLADINGAIAIGCLSYLVIMSGGVAENGIKGVGLTLKEFSLPVSMSFRLFGALLSGLLVTELVYFNIRLSYLLPIVVAVLFTLIHALVQAYVLTLLTAIFYGEVSEKHEAKS